MFDHSWNKFGQGLFRRGAGHRITEVQRFLKDHAGEFFTVLELRDSAKMDIRYSDLYRILNDLAERQLISRDGRKPRVVKYGIQLK